ncbi:helical backbone metal receptor [Stenotrophobium rhamnosiphilum]|uniref:Cobalamin-binding protein n=1 Tax=Stenotrophobium rhamnosiphilum TaxID=2029166 RepID=A0A2T5MGA5_9GAMM|nr:helical backbone metal receptor [Stenotrophobium rhamnosiphilum]PTU31614.1 cobalamin-binding protein [Stenotrophobium rhamnosiphilum]
MIRVALIIAASLYAAAGGAAERVVALAPHLAELSCAVGGCNKLVGVANYTDFPAHLEKLPHVGDAFSVNVEALIGLKPDLVLVWDGGTPPETTERLAVLGLRVVPIKVNKLADVATALERVGQLLGTADAGRAAAAAYRKRLAGLYERYRGVKPLRVMYQIEANPAFTINGQSPISEAMAVCGGVNVFAGLSQLAAPVTKESVLAANPDVVIYGEQDMGAEIRHYWAAFPQAKAQKNKNIYSMDASLLGRYSQRMLDGVEQLCSALQTARSKP